MNNIRYLSGRYVYTTGVYHLIGNHFVFMKVCDYMQPLFNNNKPDIKIYI